MSGFIVKLYRYNPEQDEAPYHQDVEVDDEFRNQMVLDVLEHLKIRDTTLAFRRSCREGVCGSDGLSINGRNGLGCITRVADALGKKDVLEIRPLPGMPVIRDLVVDQSLFFKQYERVQPWLINDTPDPAIERLQSPEDRAQLDGLYECILCACCTSACPSWWWNPEKYIGPAGLLQGRLYLAGRGRHLTGGYFRSSEPLIIHILYLRLFTVNSLCSKLCPSEAVLKRVFQTVLSVPVRCGEQNGRPKNSCKT